MVENLKAQSSSIAFAIDLLGIPDLSDNIYKKNICFSFIWFHSIYWFLFYLNSVIFPHYFTLRCSCKMSY